MKLNSFYPVLMTDKVEETAYFYRKYMVGQTRFEAWAEDIVEEGS